MFAARPCKQDYGSLRFVVAGVDDVGDHAAAAGIHDDGRLAERRCARQHKSDHAQQDAGDRPDRARAFPGDFIDNGAPAGAAAYSRDKLYFQEASCFFRRCACMEIL